MNCIDALSPPSGAANEELRLTKLQYTFAGLSQLKEPLRLSQSFLKQGLRQRRNAIKN